MSRIKPLISIILIVKNDPEVIKTLQELQKIKNIHNFEIIVVDSSDKPIDNTLLNNANLKWIHFKSKSAKKITIPEQRNRGIKKSQGDIIVFIDANCVPEKNWLDLLTNPLIKGKENIVAGSIWSSNNNTYHDRKNVILENKEYLEEAATMNLAIRKSVFNKIGDFDEQFDYGSDVDFTRRAKEQGYKIKYQPTAKIYHNWGTFKDELKRAYRYGKARVKIYKKHKINFLSILQNEPITLFYPIFILFLPISLMFPFYLLLFLVPLIKNYRYYPLRTTILNFVYGWGILVSIISGK